jgi:Putative bacterial sensory transduction regulator
MSPKRVPSCVEPNARCLYEYSPMYGARLGRSAPKQGAQAMPWWSWRAGHADTSDGDADPASAVATVTATPPEVDPLVAPVSLDRVGRALDTIDIRYLTDGSGSLLALWERHAVLFTLEGPTDEILVIRVRPHSTVPPDWADRAFRVVNEWNHTRRFCKAYVGDPTDRGQLPIYGEMQVPLGAGVHDALLTEMVDCAAAVATGFVDWLHDDGGLL